MRRRFTGNKAFNIDINNYFTVVALEDNLNVYLSNNTCEYCIDGDGNWRPLSANTTTKTISAGHTLSFRGNLTKTSLGYVNTFGISKKCNLKGNIMSMLFGDDAATNISLNGKNYAFYKLFYNCTNIIDTSELKLPATTLASNCYYGMFSGCSSLIAAPELPATTLANDCYSFMFLDCASLTTAPELPATTLTDYCYDHMFSGCRSLISTPILPATTLASYCYNSMFQNCTNLTTAPELPATTLANDCYSFMFYNCTNLTTAPELPATTLADRCYYYMFYNCTSLTTAPELPATILAEYCYYQMFYGCSNLNYIKMLATDISASNCLTNWVQMVSSTGTFVKNPAMTSLPTGQSGIPSGWTVQNA